MTNKLAAFAADTLAKLGLPGAAPKPDAAADVAATMPADDDDGEAADDADAADGAEGAKKDKGKKPMPSEDADDAEAQAVIGDAIATAAAGATAAANARWAAVMSSDEAAGRLALATTLLTNTDKDAAAIRSMLGTAPAAVGGGLLSARMADVANPAVTADGDAAPDKKAGNHGWDKVTLKVHGTIRT